MEDDVDYQTDKNQRHKSNSWSWLAIGLSSFHFISILTDNLSDVAILISSTQVIQFLQNLTYDGQSVFQFDQCPEDRNTCCGSYNLVEIASSFTLAYGIFIIFFIISLYLDIMLLQMILMRLCRPRFLQFKSFNRAVLMSKIQPILLEGIPQACMAIIFMHLEQRPLGVNCLECAVNQNAHSQSSATKTCSLNSLTIGNSYFLVLKMITVSLQTIYSFLYIMSVGFINKGRLPNSYLSCQGRAFANICFILLVAFPISLFIMVIVGSPLAFTVLYFPLPVYDDEFFPKMINQFFFVHRILFYLALPTVFMLITMMVILLSKKKPVIHCQVVFRCISYYLALFLLPIIAFLSLFYQTGVYIAILCGYGGPKYPQDEIDAAFQLATIRLL